MVLKKRFTPHRGSEVSLSWAVSERKKGGCRGAEQRPPNDKRKPWCGCANPARARIARLIGRRGAARRTRSAVTLVTVPHSTLLPTPVAERERRDRTLPNLRSAQGASERGREMAYGGGRRGSSRWGLPMVRSDALGKLGPSFGIGAGCGVGVGVGLIGGAGIGAGFPGLQLGFGAGAGCGIGIGFGYGFGKGIAYDENGKYSNIRRSFQNTRSLPYDQEFDILFDEVMESTRRLIKATTKELDKWRRM
ncbi:hypothetical protein VPH35_046670 [Triticum aestivum]